VDYIEVQGVIDGVTVRLRVSDAHSIMSLWRRSSMHFVTCRIGYCNGLLAGAPKIWWQDKLQRVMNSVARIVTNTRKFDHAGVTPAITGKLGGYKEY